MTKAPNGRIHKDLTPFSSFVFLGLQLLNRLETIGGTQGETKIVDHLSDGRVRTTIKDITGCILKRTTSVDNRRTNLLTSYELKEGISTAFAKYDKNGLMRGRIKYIDGHVKEVSQLNEPSIYSGIVYKIKNIFPQSSPINTSMIEIKNIGRIGDQSMTETVITKDGTKIFWNKTDNNPYPGTLPDYFARTNSKQTTSPIDIIEIQKNIKYPENSRFDAKSGPDICHSPEIIDKCYY